MSQSRIYTFRINEHDDKEIEACLLDGPELSRPNDFRVIIALCCSLVLRYGTDVDPKVIKKLEHILSETDLSERFDA